MRARELDNPSPSKVHVLPLIGLTLLVALVYMGISFPDDGVHCYPALRSGGRPARRVVESGEWKKE